MLWIALAFAEPNEAVLEPHRTEVAVGRGERAVEVARQHLGTPYRWEGRGTQRLPGYDCLGILFRAWGRVDGRPWTTYEVNPSQLVAHGKLGAPVSGLEGVLRDDLPDLASLRPGDVLYFLLEGYTIPDEPLLVRGEARYWPWHTGLYAGSGIVLHASPGGEVMEQPLDEMRFDALFVTRP
ncbi:MAG: hypothetical protein R3F61_01550 [Myxococcota bacterium]